MAKFMFRREINLEKMLSCLLTEQGRTIAITAAVQHGLTENPEYVELAVDYLESNNRLYEAIEICKRYKLRKKEEELRTGKYSLPEDGLVHYEKTGRFELASSLTAYMNNREKARAYQFFANLLKKQ